MDKTAKLAELIENGRRYFLSHPRRFGKSLMLSTLDAMFMGRKEYFKGLAAEYWVTRQSERPAPVLRFDMSGLRAYPSGDELNLAIVKGLEDFNLLNDINISLEPTAGGMLLRIIHKLYKQRGSIAVLIDEYDKPILIIAKDGKPDMPKVVSSAISEYRADNDWFADFLRECCVVAPDASEQSSAVYNA